MDSDNKPRINLITIDISYSFDDNVWTFHPRGEGSIPLNFKADETRMKRLLRRMRAKDSLSYPRSKKGVTYKSMIDDIASKGKSSIYVWKSHCPTSLELLKAIME